MNSLKMIFATVAMLFALSTASAEQDKPTDPAIEAFQQRLETFDKQTKAVKGDSNGVYTPQQYQQLAKLSNAVIKEYEQQSKAVRDAFPLDANMYYNQACYNAMAGNRRIALQAFESCAAAGYDEYAWVMKDTDLDNLRNDSRFQAALKKIAETGDYTTILRTCGEYAADSTFRLHFTYAAPNDRNLVRLREQFKLDSVAGSGDEISKIKRLLYWAHDVVRHDGSSYNPSQRNAIDLIEVCRKENRGVNCRMMAELLNECYLAMGFKARFVTCLPRTMINDCHVINVVYSVTLDKWVWVDPTFCAYVTDENGTLLSIQEVRERLRDGRTVQLNDDANWNHQSPQTKEHYLDYYMTKNLYHLQCVAHTGFDTETWTKGKHWTYIDLCPTGYDPQNKSSKTAKFITTTDESLFWQSPYDK